MGYAPDSWDDLVRAMRQKGYTDQELKDSGLVTVSKKNGKIFDRFRDRLMFPIIDVRGYVIGFGGRIMNNNDPNAAKYLNSPETMIFNKRKNLFALNLAKKSKLGYLILVEGYMDAVALHQYGFDCAVASLGTSLTEEHAALMTRYTDNVVLIYDGDEAGQRATRRAIPILEKAGLRVKVLRMKGAKDPDEFLKKYGADQFKVLLEEASNRVEYQLNAIARKYNIKEDDQRVRFIQECAQLISTLPSSVQREVYGHRIAEVGGISFDAMEMEVKKAWKNRQRKEQRAQEKENLAPAQNLQPKTRTVRYEHVKSARAEEGVLAMALRDPSLLDLAAQLRPEEFSVPLFAKVYIQLWQRYSAGLQPSVAALEDLDPDEMSVMASLAQSSTGPVSEQAFRDCITTIHSEHERLTASSLDDIMSMRNKMKESKGYRG